MKKRSRNLLASQSKLLGIGDSKGGPFPGVKLERTVRYDFDDVVATMEERKIKPEAVIVAD